MISTHGTLIEDVEGILRRADQVTASHRHSIEDEAFFSGAALNHLQTMLARADVPHTVLRERLALRAAEACVVFSGRSERAGALRDAVHLMRPGDLPGPAGETYLAWLRAVERPMTTLSLKRALPGLEAGRVAKWPGGAARAPVARAASVLETMLEEAPHQETQALVLADAVLAHALGLDHLTPLLAAGLKRADLRKQGEDLRMACHRALAIAAVDAGRLALDLTRRAAHLKVIAPRLRAKGAEAAVTMFLTRDAVTPAALPLPDRAARRLCDRLVDLRAVRELSGRETFRLYGI